MSSRERLLAALECRPVDHLPCCFSGFQSLREECRDQAEFLDRQLQMGLDAISYVTQLAMPVRHDPSVRIRQWREDLPGERYPILHKAYETPAGNLTISVDKDPDWPFGDSIPVWDDFIVTRARKFPLSPDDSMDAFRLLMGPPSRDDVHTFRTMLRTAKSLAADRGLLTVADFNIADRASSFTGMETLIILSLDRPDFVHDLIDVLEKWNQSYIDIILEERVDLVVRRGWYENADFWAPKLYRKFLLPGLQRHADMVHQAGAKFGYLVSCSSMPLLDVMMDVGVDVLLGVDPAQDRSMDLALLKQKTAGRMCLWGGVCGYLTVECGSPDDIRREVQQAITTLAPGGGFILAPVTNIRAHSPQAWENAHALVDAWLRMR